MSTLVQSSFADSILEIKLTINEQNSFTLDAFGQLDRALTDAAQRSDVRSLILSSGTPDFFSNGLNPQAVHSGTPEELNKLVGLFFSVLKNLYLFGAPTVASISGHAVGYGAMLGAMCDFRLIVDKGARMSFPELNIGVTLPAFVTLRLTDLVGERMLRDLLFAGLAPKPPEALAIGLVDEIVPAEELTNKSRKLAKRLAGLPRNATRLQKAILRGQYERNWDAIIAQDVKSTLELFGTKEPKEGFAALVEKRRPVFE